MISVSQQANALVNSLIGENRISTLGLVVVDEVSESKICSIILLSTDKLLCAEHLLWIIVKFCMSQIYYILLLTHTGNFLTNRLIVLYKIMVSHGLVF